MTRCPQIERIAGSLKGIIRFEGVSTFVYSISQLAWWH
jgi:hypothetical protein